MNSQRWPPHLPVCFVLMPRIPHRFPAQLRSVSANSCTVRISISWDSPAQHPTLFKRYEPISRTVSDQPAASRASAQSPHSGICEIIAKEVCGRNISRHWKRMSCLNRRKIKKIEEESSEATLRRWKGGSNRSICRA